MVRFSAAWIAFFLFFFLSPSTQVDTMTPSNPLADGQTLVSAGGRFQLGFFSPVNSQKRYLGIWHDNIPIETVVWVANRESPILGTTATLVLDDTGHLVLAAGRNSTVVWSSPTVMTIDSPVAQLLDSGNLVVRDAAGAGFAWQSFDHPTDTLLPGMKLGFDLTAGLNRSLNAWKKSFDPSFGAYSVVLEGGVEPQIVQQASSDQLWRSGPWNGLRFSGMPEMKGFNFTLVKKETEVYFMYHSSNESIISNLVLSTSGSINLRVWDPRTSNWNLWWYAPENQCDTLAPCGPNGVCNADSSPVCSCLMGFTPRVPNAWALRDGSDGCVRRTEPDCTSDSTGFRIMRNMKLPDTAGLRRDMVITFEECRAICQFNCSCYAYASADISGGGQGCMIWNSGLIGLEVLPAGGQDLYLRLDNTVPKELNQTHFDMGGGRSGGMRPIAIIIGTVTFGTLVLGLAGCIIWWKKRKAKDSIHNSYNDEITQEEDFDLPMLDLKTIMIATDNFSIKNKLGEGGFGPVYKGRLGDGRDIAVKRLSKSSIQGAREFKNEVILIARLQHRNLVRLLGCCIQGEEKILVYEYMPNKSLDSFLFDKTNDSLAAWDLRYNIILGIARGLLYLHQDSRFRIIHRDLKASNILLDKVMNPKISDFGMARIFGGEENEASTRRVVGTYGYMSPEYIMEGIFSVKSDVFSFGVLLLEIISGKRNRGNEFSENHGNLLGYAWNFWREGIGLEIVDRSMECSYPTNKVLRCINIGLLCAQERPEDRPTMSSVVLMLSSDDGVLPHPKRPGFVLTEAPLESRNSRKELCSLNDVTLTLLDGR